MTEDEYNEANKVIYAEYDRRHAELRQRTDMTDEQRQAAMLQIEKWLVQKIDRLDAHYLGKMR